MPKGIGHAAGRHGKGRLFKRGRVWWIQYYANGQQVRESSRSDKKAVAEKMLMRRLVEAEAGTVPAREKPITYQELRERLVTTWLLDKPSPSPHENDQALARPAEFFKNLAAGVITEEKTAETS